MHEDSIFLTLTYNDENLESPRLIYPHFQKFMKDLRDRQGYEPDQRITYMVTGEYGDKNKRPHWHALVFNYRPKDATKHYRTQLGHQVYTSKALTDLWKRGNCEFGDITLDSASYVARYAAKKLTHGRDQDHNYHPFHRTSSRRAIGRTWIEAFWQQTFAHGFVNLPNGTRAAIPRYYRDWLRTHKFDEYMRYVTEVRPGIADLAEQNARQEQLYYFTQILNLQPGWPYPLTRAKVKETILKSKFKQLQERLKL